MVRAPCCDKNGMKKGPWTPEEDHKLISYIQLHGPGNWRTLPKNAGLQRCGKSCRLRWTNYLRPDIKRGRFSFEEEEAIIQLHSILGNKWSAIAARLPGRTDNEIKNFWNTHVRKRMLRNGIDPVMHAPRLDLLDLSSLLSSALCNQSILLNLSNMLNAQALVNPDLLRLISTLSTLKQENPELFLQILQESQLVNSQEQLLQNQLSSQPNNNNLLFQNLMSQELDSSCNTTSNSTNSTKPSSPFLDETGPFVQKPNVSSMNLVSSSLDNGSFSVASPTNFLYSNTNPTDSEPILDNAKLISILNNGCTNVGIDSAISTPISSPGCPFISSYTEDERGSYCSSLFKFEIPESLDLEDFM